MSDIETFFKTLSFVIVFAFIVVIGYAINRATGSVVLMIIVQIFLWHLYNESIKK